MYFLKENFVEKLCCVCSEPFQHKRWSLGYRTCLSCGEKISRQVKHTIVPLHKSHYRPIINLEELKTINKYENFT